MLINCSFENKFIVLFIVIFGTLSFPIHSNLANLIQWHGYFNKPVKFAYYLLRKLFYLVVFFEGVRCVAINVSVCLSARISQKPYFTEHFTKYLRRPAGEQIIVCLSVCLSVCLCSSASISSELRVRYSLNFCIR